MHHPRSAPAPRQERLRRVSLATRRERSGKSAHCAPLHSLFWFGVSQGQAAARGCAALTSHTPSRAHQNPRERGQGPEVARTPQGRPRAEGATRVARDRATVAPLALRGLWPLAALLGDQTRQIRPERLQVAALGFQQAPQDVAVLPGHELQSTLVVALLPDRPRSSRPHSGARTV